ncbi:Spermidine synthase [Thermodesulfobium narugense DSM 14796]|uniref:Polyamine aminopropyltransferase n=1 Tax=Thermodesulfobium narugense DSM 14796 TaxID=747365 RepID=M1E6Y2_9BACT|nr:polyamine aminopropyltransferase [Thermodesulfobium narugense]AEE14373.1 Spermidine synthase [Thermodesulfobium narugense DSM 14796]
MVLGDNNIPIFQFKEEHLPGSGIYFDVIDILFSAHSKYQRIEVFQTTSYGKVLLVDGKVMLTERDEFVYHEMLTHVPLNLSDKIKEVLIIGGGDGGSARECLKHKNIKHIKQVEIDEMVVEVSKKFFPSLSSGFNDPRFELCICDGINFVKQTSDKFDLVLVDSTDPIGPAVGLFEADFFENIKRILNPEGILVFQLESPWCHLEFISEVSKKVKNIFPIFKNYVAFIPTYPAGLWSFGFASFTIDPIKELPSDISISDLKYYTTEIHKASFALPRFFKNYVRDV